MMDGRNEKRGSATLEVSDYAALDEVAKIDDYLKRIRPILEKAFEKRQELKAVYICLCQNYFNRYANDTEDPNSFDREYQGLKEKLKKGVLHLIEAKQTISSTYNEDKEILLNVIDLYYVLIKYKYLFRGDNTQEILKLSEDNNPRKHIKTYDKNIKTIQQTLAAFKKFNELRLRDELLPQRVSNYQQQLEQIVQAEEGSLLSRVAQYRDDFYDLLKMRDDVGQLGHLMQLNGIVNIIKREKLVRLTSLPNYSVDAVTCDSDEEFKKYDTELLDAKVAENSASRALKNAKACIVNQDMQAISRRLYTEARNIRKELENTLKESLSYLQQEVFKSKDESGNEIKSDQTILQTTYAKTIGMITGRPPLQAFDEWSDGLKKDVDEFEPVIADVIAKSLRVIESGCKFISSEKDQSAGEEILPELEKQLDAAIRKINLVRDDFKIRATVGLKNVLSEAKERQQQNKQNYQDELDGLLNEIEEYKPKYRKFGKWLGGALGGVGGAFAGGIGGAFLGSPGGPLGAVLGAVAGAIAGGIVGASAGAAIGHFLIDACIRPTIKPVHQIELSYRSGERPQLTPREQPIHQPYQLIVFPQPDPTIYPSLDQEPSSRPPSPPSPPDTPKGEPEASINSPPFSKHRRRSGGSLGRSELAPHEGDGRSTTRYSGFFRRTTSSPNVNQLRREGGFVEQKQQSQAIDSVKPTGPGST